MEPNYKEAFLWEPGKGKTMLGTLGGKTSVTLGMNNRGQIIGVSSLASGGLCAFLWDKAAGMKELSAPEGNGFWPTSISDAGQILVTYPDRQSLFDPNGPISLKTLPPKTWLHTMNRRFCMAGIEKPIGPTWYLVLWDERKTLRRLVPANNEHATRLNDKNQIAYTEFRRNRRKELEDRYIRRRFDLDETVSYLWDPARRRVPLNRYVCDMERFHVMDLNNNGCIIGQGEMKDGSTRSVLLEPIPGRWGR